MKQRLWVLISALFLAMLPISAPRAQADNSLGDGFNGYNLPMTSAEAGGGAVTLRGVDTRPPQLEADGTIHIDVPHGAVASSEAPGGGWSLLLTAYEKQLLFGVGLSPSKDDIEIRRRAPPTGYGLYSLVGICADAPDPAACQEEEACTQTNGEPGQNHYIQFYEDQTRQTSHRLSEPLCVDPENIPEAASLPVVTTEDLKRLDIGAAVAVVEPAPHTLINYNTNVYAHARAQEFTTTLAGYPVTVRVYPIAYTWDYGDGTTLGPTTHSGYPLGEDEWDTPTETSHRYTKTGDVHVTLTTTFEGEYSIAGGPWLPVEGTTTVTSTPVELKVWRTKIRNYADDCIINPAGTGC